MTLANAKEILELALHPVRMRILMLLAGSPGLAPQQIADQMDDIPQATLYRQINRLAQAGLLTVVSERPVRGTLEKVYALNAESPSQIAGQDGLDAFNRLSKEDHLRYFTAFTLTLLDDFSRYLHRQSAQPDMIRDGVGYHKLAMFLSDDELADFSTAMNQALLPFIGLPAAPGRHKRLFTTLMMPTDDPLEPPADMSSYNHED